MQRHQKKGKGQVKPIGSFALFETFHNRVGGKGRRGTIHKSTLSRGGTKKKGNKKLKCGETEKRNFQWQGSFPKRDEAFTEKGLDKGNTRVSVRQT